MQVHGRELVVDRIRSGKNVRDVGGERLNRRCTGISEPIVRSGDVQMDLGRFAAPTQVRIEAVEIRSASLTEAAVMGRIGRHVDRKLSRLPTQFENARPTVVRGAKCRYSIRVVGEPVL